MKLTKLFKLLSIASALALASCCGEAKGATLIYNLDTIQTGATPSGTAPWTTISFTDDGVNQVLLSINSNLQGANEFISEVNFNFNPTLNLSNLTVTPVGGVGSYSYMGSPVLSLDNINGGSGSKYDVGINFNNGTFNGTDQSWIRLTYNGTGTFDANSFNFGDSKNNELATVHIQGIGNNSSWTTATVVPEPSCAILGAFGTLTLLRRRRH